MIRPINHSPSLVGPMHRTAVTTLSSKARTLVFTTPPSTGSRPYSSVGQELHRRKDWDHLRLHKLTASTFAGAIGFWRGRRVKLWHEKLTLTPPFAGNLATRWSDAHESLALQRYALITGNPIDLPPFHVHPDHDWLAASADAILEHSLSGLPLHGVLEVKCPYFNGKVETGRIKRRSPYPWSRMPVHYMPQAQGLMEILDKNWLDLYCWTPNGSSLIRVWRNPDYWRLLKVALSDFWFGHVVPAKEICAMQYAGDETWDADLNALVPTERHKLCDNIFVLSHELVDRSELLIREMHGKPRWYRYYP